MMRLDRLTANQQLTLKVASVLGQTFQRATLAGIHPIAEDRPQLHEHLAGIYSLTYHPDVLLLLPYISLQTLNLAEQLGPSPLLARAYANAYLTAVHIRNKRLADFYHGQAEQILDQIDHAGARAWLLFALSMASIFHGHWEQAVGYSEQGMDLSREIRDYHRYLQYWSTQTKALVYQGALEQAFRSWERSLVVARSFSMPYKQGLAHLQLGRHSLDAEHRFHLAHAIAIFARIGATADLRATIAAARRSSLGQGAEAYE